MHSTLCLMTDDKSKNKETLLIKKLIAHNRNEASLKYKVYKVGAISILFQVFRGKKLPTTPPLRLLVDRQNNNKKCALTLLNLGSEELICCFTDSSMMQHWLQSYHFQGCNSTGTTVAATGQCCGCRSTISYEHWLQLLLGVYFIIYIYIVLFRYILYFIYTIFKKTGFRGHTQYKPINLP